MKSFLAFCFIIYINGNLFAQEISVDLSSLQQKNSSQLNSVNTNFSNIIANNESYIKQINPDTVQQTNKTKIAGVKLTKNKIPDWNESWMEPNVIQINEIVNQNIKTLSTQQVTTTVALYLSFTSMDKDSILMYAQQAQTYKVPIVLRGFIKNSVKETMEYIKNIRTLFPTLTIMIDPPAYSKYNINVVPTMVVSKLSSNPIQSGCNSPGDYAKVSGEVSIQAMLNFIHTNSKNPALVKIADDKLNEVSSKSFFRQDNHG